MKINLKNYEEYLLSYVDGELDPDEKTGLLSFLEEHPELQSELKLLESAKLTDVEGPVFPDKESLYRRAVPVENKVVFLRRHPWLAVASAACVFLVAALFFVSPRKDLSTGQTAVRTVHSGTPPAAIPRAEKQDSPLDQAISPQPRTEKQALASHRTKKKEKESRAAALPTQPHPAVALGRNESPAHDKAISGIRDLPKINGGPVSSGNEESLASIQVPSGAKVPQPGDAGGSPKKEEGRMIGGNLAVAAQTMDDAKKEIDNTITRKLSDLHEKTTGLIDQLAQKGIRIGRITFAFND